VKQRAASTPVRKAPPPARVRHDDPGSAIRVEVRYADSDDPATIQRIVEVLRRLLARTAKR